MARMRRKRRTREHILEDLSIHHVEGHVLRCGWVVERMEHDYGIDLEIITFDRVGQVEAGSVLLQVKATDRSRSRRKTTTVAFRLDRSDLVLWLAELRPVILIVYDARKDIAYWLYIQSYFQRLKGFSLFTAGQTVTIYLPTVNILTRAAVRRFARFRDAVVAQNKEVIRDEDAAGPLR